MDGAANAVFRDTRGREWGLGREKGEGREAAKNYHYTSGH